MGNAKFVIDFCFAFLFIMCIFNVAQYHSVIIRTQCTYFMLSKSTNKWKQREVLEERDTNRAIRFSFKSACLYSCGLK